VKELLGHRHVTNNPALQPTDDPEVISEFSAFGGG